MVDNEKYINFLKSINSCISNGDYFSVKELSNFELEKIIQEEKKNKEKIKKIKKSKKSLKKNIKKLENNELKQLKEVIEEYSEYILNMIKINKNIEELQKEVISIKEFVNNI